MKIGILTFHSQLNYGGVLQCWALKTVLEGMGHEVVVVDRWSDEKNASLRNEFALLGWKGWAKLIIRGLIGCGDLGKLLRTIRTIRFVRGLGLSKEHFCEWSELEQSNNRTIEQLDLLIVGSDQVWHCGDWGNPRPYLLEGAPAMKAISYAASFGMTAVPADQIELYKRGLGRFAAISCREQEGVEICRRLGFKATHVIDPTLLVDPTAWSRLVKFNTQTCGCSCRRKLVCYLMSVDLFSILPSLERFARVMNCSVEVLANEPNLRPAPRSFSALVLNLCRKRVKVRRGAGPKEFVHAFMTATWVISDSFHGLMFSSIFNCNVRILRPENELRRVMFARVEEFVRRCVQGRCLVDKVENALLSFRQDERILYDTKWMAVMHANSMNWLECALRRENI